MQSVHNKIDIDVKCTTCSSRGVKDLEDCGLVCQGQAQLIHLCRL